MLDFRVIQLEDESAWREALAGIPHSFHHSHEYARVMQLTTGYEAFLLSIRGPGVELACSLVERPILDELDIATASGLSGFAGNGTWEAIRPSWKEFIRHKRYVSGYIGLHPLFGPTDLDRAPSHNTLYVLDLSLGQEELLRSMDTNRRRELRGWEERRADLEHERDEVASFLRSNYYAFMRDLGAQPPLLTDQGLDLLCHSESCIVVGTREGDELDAAYVFGTTPHAGDWLLSVSSGEGRRRSTDLLWYGATVLIDRGVPLLNLGGGVDEDDPVARAKQRFGPCGVPLRALREIYRPDKYEEICTTLQSRPASDAYFPAYRAPTGMQPKTNSI